MYLIGERFQPFQGLTINNEWILLNTVVYVDCNKRKLEGTYANQV